MKGWARSRKVATRSEIYCRLPRLMWPIVALASPPILHFFPGASRASSPCQNVGRERWRLQLNALNSRESGVEFSPHAAVTVSHSSTASPGSTSPVPAPVCVDERRRGGVDILFSRVMPTRRPARCLSQGVQAMVSGCRTSDSYSLPDGYDEPEILLSAINPPGSSQWR